MLAYFVGFSLIWFGGIVGFIIIGDLAHHWTLGRAFVALGALAIALAPPLVTARLPFDVTLSDDGTCEFRSLLSRRRVLVDEIRSITSDDDGEYIYIRHDRGKIYVVCDEAFKALLIQLVELNPLIELEDWLRGEVDEAVGAS
jgi:hypothetical protein